MPEKSKQARKTILVVDDEEAIRTFVTTVLIQSSYHVMLAESGEDALRQSRAYKDTIHLLLANVQMPGITGMELGAKISLERPEIRVMLMSGFSSGMLVLNEGWQFLHKPFIPSQLRELVAHVLAPTDPAVIPDLDEHKRRDAAY